MSHFSKLHILPSQKIFAIGDIHGCSEELEELVQLLESSHNLTTNDIVVFLGDYIDRGPYSRKVIEYLIEFKKQYPYARFLKGNHEDMVLDFMGFGGHYGSWCVINGANKFFKDYDLENCYAWIKDSGVRERVCINRHWGNLNKLRSKIPEDHLEFLKNLETGLVSEDYIFVHAGVCPYKPLEDQNLEDLHWIREDFLMWEHADPRTVVHGHSPGKLPYHDTILRRVNLDTGCFKGGSLSAVELRSMEFIIVPSKQLYDW